KAGTYVWVDVGKFKVILYEDRFSQPVQSYNLFYVKNYLQFLADNYKIGMSTRDAIAKPLEDKYLKYCWNSFVVEEELDKYGIATRPSNLPILEVRGPNGQRIFAWAVRKE